MADATCSVEGCPQPARARGWCKMHYARWRRNGDPGAASSGHHGQTDTPLWKAWKWMRDRTTERFQRDNPTYADVSLDERWRTFPGFLTNPPVGSFARDITGRWPEISRIDDVGDYSPENCRWLPRADNRDEMLARRKLRLDDGRFAADVAAQNNISQSTWKTRYYQYGWALEDAVSRPVDRRMRNRRAL